MKNKEIEGEAKGEGGGKDHASFCFFMPVVILFTTAAAQARQKTLGKSQAEERLKKAALCIV